MRMAVTAPVPIVGQRHVALQQFRITWRIDVTHATRAALNRTYAIRRLLI